MRKPVVVVIHILKNPKSEPLNSLPLLSPRGRKAPNAAARRSSLDYFTTRARNFCKCLIEHPKLDRCFTSFRFMGGKGPAPSDPVRPLFPMTADDRLGQDQKAEKAEIF
jgi:hypothetical protein